MRVNTISKILKTSKGELKEYWYKCTVNKNLDLITVTNGWQSFNVYIEDWEKIETIGELVNYSVSRKLVYINGKAHFRYIKFCDYVKFLEIYEPTFYDLVTKEREPND